MANHSDHTGSLYEFLCEETKGLDAVEAVEYFGKIYTFGEVKQNILSVAAALRNCGIRKGDRVVLSLITTPETLFLMYACGLIGVVAVMADVRYSRDELSELCEKITPKMVFIHDWQGSEVGYLQSKYEKIVFVVVSPCAGFPAIIDFFRGYYRFFTGNLFYKHGERGISWRRFIKYASGSLLPKEEAYKGKTDVVFATSGTTGKRKYVVLDNEKLNLSAIQHKDCGNDYSDIETLLSIMPLFTCYGFVSSVHFPLLMGKKLILYPIYNSTAIPKVIAKKKPNAYAGVPYHFEEMMRSKALSNADLSFLKHLFSGGERVTAEFEDEFNSFLRQRNSSAMLLQGYGMTEVSACVCLQREWKYEKGSAGIPLGQAQLIIVDENDGITEKSNGESGEICIHTPCRMSGYLEDEEATSSLLRIHPDGLCWVHTGDIGHKDAEGNLFIDGRIKRMTVSSSGTKVFLQIVEDRVKKIEGVVDCAFVSHVENGTSYERRLVLFVEPVKGYSRKTLLSEIDEISKHELPMYLVPDAIAFYEKLPKTSTGKNDIRYLETVPIGDAIMRKQKER